MTTNKYTVPTRKNIELEPLHVVILAGGVGFREKKQGVKALTQIGENTLVEHQLRVLRHVYPKAIVTVTVGFEAERIIKSKLNVAFIENTRWDEFNSVEEMRLYLNAFNPSRLLIIDGSVHFNEHAIQPLSSYSSVLLYSNSDNQEIGCREEDGKIVRLDYGLTTKWSGLVYLDGLALERFKKLVVRSNSKLFLYESLNLLLEKKVEIGAIYSTKAEIIKF